MLDYDRQDLLGLKWEGNEEEQRVEAVQRKAMVAQTNEFRKRKELMAIMTSGPEESKETEGLRETRLTYGRERSSTKTRRKWQGDGEESDKF